MLQSLPQYELVIRQLGISDAGLFCELGSISSLGSLMDPARRRALLEEGLVIGAVWKDALIGCSCLQADVRREYFGLDGELHQLPLSSVYLCSTFVHPDHRGSGVGFRLYAERLRTADKLGRSNLAIEILGKGVPLTIDDVAHVGYRFHADAGFYVAGYSAEVDHGPMLMRDVPVSDVPVPPSVQLSG